MEQKAREENTQTNYGRLWTRTHRHRDGTPTSQAAEEIIAVHWEQRGMGYGFHLPQTSQVGNQVHQDDPVNEAVHDAFGVQDDNFTRGAGSRTCFLQERCSLGIFQLHG
ncbi:hypothetical protein K1719_021060 [Acacia pycnantha]|nr:hypothetical protein K1719_021060 [Acacia pycnantha]